MKPIALKSTMDVKGDKDMLEPNEYWYVSLSNEALCRLIEEHINVSFKHTVNEDYPWEEMLTLVITKELTLCKKNFENAIDTIAEVRFIKGKQTSSFMFRFDEASNFTSAFNEEAIDELYDRLERYEI